MSYRVLLVLEDPTYDQYIVKPLVERLCGQAGRRNVRVDVLLDPHLRGVEQALDADVWEQIACKYPMIDLFLLVIDRDCVPARQARLDNVRANMTSNRRGMDGCLAIEEVEVWLLAGFRGKLGEPWNVVRKECHPKERFFEPFMRAQEARGVGGGRLRLMRAAVRKLAPLTQACPEIRQILDALRPKRRR